MQGEFYARSAICETLARYTRFGDSADFEGVASQFADDGVLRTADAASQGRDEIVRYLHQAADRFTGHEVLWPFRHHVSSVYVDVVDDQCAHARSYFVVMSREGPDHWGRYDDQLVHRGARWLFQLRHVTVESSKDNSPMAHLVAARGSTPPNKR